MTFVVDGVTVHGTYLHPPGAGEPVPAAVLIAGSGPTDRNGNSPAVPGSMNTLRHLAATLASDGIATLRYDKLGSGTTGMGRFAAHPGRVGLKPFTHEARAALTFLARRPGVDSRQLSIYGHSEGALFALLVATDHAKHTPPVQSLGLIEPLSKRYLDVLSEQVTTQVHQQRASGRIDKHTAHQALSQMRKAVRQLRSKGTVPPDLGFGLDHLFRPDTLRFLREADAIDPADLAAKLPATTPVLITCSDTDIQVSCADVQHLAAAVTPRALDFVHLKGVDHVLKEDRSRTAAHYGEDLPFSRQLITAVHTFTTKDPGAHE